MRVKYLCHGGCQGLRCPIKLRMVFPWCFLLVGNTLSFECQQLKWFLKKLLLMPIYAVKKWKVQGSSAHLIAWVIAYLSSLKQCWTFSEKRDVAEHVYRSRSPSYIFPETQRTHISSAKTQWWGEFRFKLEVQCVNPFCVAIKNTWDWVVGSCFCRLYKHGTSICSASSESSGSFRSWWKVKGGDGERRSERRRCHTL